MKFITGYDDYIKIFEFKYNNLSEIKAKFKELAVENKVPKSYLDKLAYIVRKTPNLIYNFLLYYLELKKNPDLTSDQIFEKLTDLYKEASEKKDLFKFDDDEDFTKYDTIEKLTDKIDSIQNDITARKYLSALPAELQREIKENYFDRFRNIVINYKTEDQYRDYRTFIQKNIKFVNKPIEFLDLLEDMVNKSIGYRKQIMDALNTPEGKNIKILFDENNILVLQVFNEADVDLVGTSNWCISSTRNMFKKYVPNKSYKQLIIHDFTKNTTDPMSLIGATLDENNEISISDGKHFDVHDKADVRVDPMYIFKLLYLNGAKDIIKFSGRYVKTIDELIFVKNELNIEFTSDDVIDKIRNCEQIKLVIDNNLLNTTELYDVLFSHDIVHDFKDYSEVVNFLQYLNKTVGLGFINIVGYNIARIVQSFSEIKILYSKKIINRDIIKNGINLSNIGQLLTNLEDLKICIINNYFDFNILSEAFQSDKIKIKQILPTIPDLFNFFDFCIERNILKEIFNPNIISITIFGIGGFKNWVLFLKYFTVDELINMILNSKINRGYILFQAIDASSMIAVLSNFIKSGIYNEQLLSSIFSKYSIYDMANTPEELVQFIDLIEEKNCIDMCIPKKELKNNKFIFDKLPPRLSNKYTTIKNNIYDKYAVIANKLDSKQL